MKKIVSIFVFFIALYVNAQDSKNALLVEKELLEVLGISKQKLLELTSFEKQSKKSFVLLAQKNRDSEDWKYIKKDFSIAKEKKIISILGKENYAKWQSHIQRKKLEKEQAALELEIQKYKRTDPNQPYEPVWGSLKQHKIPKWAEDAKFGVYAHWGIYSQTGAWDYKKRNWGNYYITAYKGVYNTNPKQEQRQMFEEKYGKITDGNGYIDLAKDFKAENWDPVYWADLLHKSGAKYAGICAVHHDGYCMWDSEFTDFCAGKLGPKRDLYGELITEIRNRGLKTIASFHHGRTYKHYQGLIKKLKKDPIYNRVDLLDSKNDHYYWFTGSQERFTKNRLDLTLEFIDKYAPDVLWFDGGGGAYDTEKILARHFNNALKNNTEVCVHNKGNFGTNFGIYSYENGYARPSYVDWPWEDDTPSSVGWCDWQWDKNIQYKTARHVIVRLADLVSRNGGLLLSINPKSDGTLDQGQIDLLLGVGDWLGKYGEAIYGTHPWKLIGEGHLDNLFYTQINPDSGRSSRAIQPETSLFDATDIRYTTKDNVLYAIVLGVPESDVMTIETLNSNQSVSDKNKIKSIELLGNGFCKFHRDAKGVHIELPQKMPDTNAVVFKISVNGTLEVRKNEGKNSIVPMKT
ncbi:MAG: alpha-L-fucosidase [Flavicella sp.]